MKNERKQQLLSVDPDHRFVIIYGKGVDDTYISDQYKEQNLEQVLHDELIQRGFERIVYFSPHRSIYYLDDHSQALGQPQVSRKIGFKESRNANKISGPLGDTQLLQPINLSDDQEMKTGDVHAIRQLDAYIRDETGPKTAIILTQAETIFNYFEDQRTLAGLIGEWTRLKAVNPNLCVFIFSIASFQGLHDMAQHLPVPELRNYISNYHHRSSGTNNIVHLAGPDYKELERLILYLVKAFKVKVVKSDYQQVCKWMVAENLLASQWIKRGRSIHKLDISTAISHGWFRAHRTPEKSAMEKVEALTGLYQIKNRIRELTGYARIIHNQPDFYQSDDAPSLHMVFTGNPGTGKTTIARLIGELFHELDLLPRGHLIEVQASDLIAEHVGGTRIKTNKIIDQALDGVLFIDEAYALSEEERGTYGQEAIETLLTRLEDDRNRLVVIIAGYPAKMTKFIHSNPGLRRRFPADNMMHFPDYSVEELFTILESILQRRHIPLDQQIRSHLTDVIKGLVASRDQNFGNAGEIRNFADALTRKYSDRIAEQSNPDEIALSFEDISEQYQSYLPKPLPDITEVMAELDHLVGLDEVKSFLYRKVQKLQIAQLRQQKYDLQTNQINAEHLVFCGKPGTGKTTVARLMGKIYQSLGLLHTGHVIEVSRADLVAGYVGQTALKTNEKILAALDGILFIDEAYTLNRGDDRDFGKESIDCLVKAMEDYKNRLVIIAAGYPQEMEEFLNSNPGLKSRFAPPIVFAQFSIEEMASILTELADGEGYTFTPPAIEKAKHLIQEIQEYQKDHFGYARTIHTIFEEIKGMLAERVLSSMDGKDIDIDLNTIKEEDIPELIIPLDQDDLRKEEVTSSVFPSKHSFTGGSNSLVVSKTTSMNFERP